MILQALTEYYDALLEQGQISPPGWDNTCKVSYGLELDSSGSVVELIPYQHTELKGSNNKETLLNFQIMRVPARVKRTVGIAANFLCDTSSYILGIDAKGKPERAKECYEACRELHRQILTGVDSPAATAILGFFSKWNPESASDNPCIREGMQGITAGGNLIFCYDMEPVTLDPVIARVWQEYYGSAPEGAVTAQCLVTGKTGTVARLHPSIKGVYGAQSSGASLVSFNAPAFESFGHTQGENAPVSEYAAFAYTTALNRLVSDRDHYRLIGDTTVVCWAQNGQKVYQDLGMEALFGAPQGVDDNLLSAILQKLARGEACEWENISINPGEHFYFMGLSPNASRLSVRFFIRDSFGNFMKNIERHYRDISVVRPSYDEVDNIPLWRLLNETVNQNSRTKSASPQMAGSVLMAILNGTPYPATLLNGAQLRIRAEHNITRGRAAIIKAYYLRHPNSGCPEEVLQMELNESSTDIAYTLGRMFSLYEQIQQAANPNLNATIKDKYFNSASATPATIFPLLGNLAQKHLRVLRRDKGGLAVVLERKLGELSVIVGKEYPTNLSLPQQGSFQLGYYFENQARYQKKEDK